MRVWHFSETAYPYLPDPETYDSVRVTLPSKHYDPRKGADIYHRRLDEWCLADELGLDIMLNEHHQTPTCTVPAISVIAGILARQTENARILLLGNPLANRRQPIRVAEEMAMIDVISHGRLDCGFVRGVPFELPAANSNPVRMKERLWEAHDLIVKAWTSHEGPFNWEGKFFHHRQVNVWPRPWQQPHPPIWITTGNPANAEEIAEKGLIAATFITGFSGCKAIFDAYRAGWRASHGGEAPLDRMAYLGFCYVGETDEEGFAGAEKLLWYLTANKAPPHFRSPPGYLSPEARAAIHKAGVPKLEDHRIPEVQTQIRVGNMFAGNPDTVFEQIKAFYDHVGGFGNLMIMGQAGFMDHDETSRGMKLFAKEVYPRVKELTATVPA